MAQPAILCTSCGILFNSGIDVRGSGSVFIQNGHFQCPNCRTMVHLNEMLITAAGIFSHFQTQANPLIAAEEFISDLSGIITPADLAVARTGKLKAYEKWLPNDISKLSALIVLLIELIKFLIPESSGVPLKTEMNDTNLHEAYPSLQESSNAKCHCGSGRSYARCQMRWTKHPHPKKKNGR